MLTNKNYRFERELDSLRKELEIATSSSNAEDESLNDNDNNNNNHSGESNRKLD